MTYCQKLGLDKVLESSDSDSVGKKTSPNELEQRVISSLLEALPNPLKF